MALHKTRVRNVTLHQHKINTPLLLSQSQGLIPPLTTGREVEWVPASAMAYVKVPTVMHMKSNCNTIKIFGQTFTSPP